MSISLLQEAMQAAGAVCSNLDLYSISQTSELANETYAVNIPALKCVNHAPFFAWKTSDKAYAIAQGNCNSWSCPRCGQIRAKQEYWRIVNGCKTLAASHDLYFITITCRGKEMSLEQSEAGYLTWTNKLLTALRTRTTRAGQAWHYVQVTERQKRGHPHSHILTTYKPHDLYVGTKQQWINKNGELVSELKPALRSDYLEQRCVAAGLGNQYDISQVETVDAASRYVAKYLFKGTMFSIEWTKHWRRVRYSQSFPASETLETDAMLLLKREDWQLLASTALVVNPQSEAARDECLKQLHGHDILIKNPVKVSE